MNTIIICLTIALIASLIILSFLLYNQMFLVNQVNKRLLVLTKECIEHERATQEDLQNAIRELDALTNEDLPQPQINLNEPQQEFDPFKTLDDIENGITHEE